MLRQETNETIPPTAAQARVTPEELAAAITRLEARKDAGQRHLEGTIPIGEAVQQLGLEATPEEVLAEVQAGRRLATPEKRRASVGKRLVLLLGLCGILLGLALDGNGLREMQSHPAAVSTDVSHMARPISFDPNLLVGDATGRLVTLSEVGDNQPVRCTFDNEASFFRQYLPANAQASWTLIKHGGKVYVRGRALRVSPGVFSSLGLDVTNVVNDPQYVVPVTLPLSGFQVLANVGNDGLFHAQNIHLDKHAYEKWKP